MLNKIGDDAAEEMLSFYHAHLEQGVEGSARYEAHYAIALLTWRKQGQAAIEEIIRHFRAAAAQAVAIFVAREAKRDRGREDLFNFMFPLLVIYIFGEKVDRNKLTSLEREQWGPQTDEEYQSLIELFDLLLRNADDRKFSRTDIQKVIEVNENFVTHPFYQPWIKAFCDCLLAITEQNTDRVTSNIEALIELHDDEAYDGSWSNTPDGLMGFWPLAAVITAQIYNIVPAVESVYLPSIPKEFLR